MEIFDFDKLQREVKDNIIKEINDPSNIIKFVDYISVSHDSDDLKICITLSNISER